MEDVETRFKLALQYIDKGGLAAQHPGQSPPSNEVLLEYYALYKQAHLGDCREREPWKIQAIAYHKWHAWNSKRGMSKAAAMQEYVDQLTSKVPKWREWEGLPPVAVPVPRAVAAASEDVRTLLPSASNAATPIKHSALQSPEFISSSLNAKLPQDPNINFGSPEHRPALHSSPTHPHCHSTPPHLSAKSSGFVTACAQRQCWACYITSAIASIIFFCAAAIILLSSTTSNHGANAAASEESHRAAESWPQCHHFNGLQHSHRLFAFLQSPDGALLLFATSVFLAAISRSSFTAWNALKAASTELEQAFEERQQLLRTLQSSASAKEMQVALASISTSKGWSFLYGSRVISIFFENASTASSTPR